MARQRAVPTRPCGRSINAAKAAFNRNPLGGKLNGFFVWGRVSGEEGPRARVAQRGSEQSRITAGGRRRYAEHRAVRDGGRGVSGEEGPRARLAHGDPSNRESRP